LLLVNLVAVAVPTAMLMLVCPKGTLAVGDIEIMAPDPTPNVPDPPMVIAGLVVVTTAALATFVNVMLPAATVPAAKPWPLTRMDVGAVPRKLNVVVPDWALSNATHGLTVYEAVAESADVEPSAVKVFDPPVWSGVVTVPIAALPLVPVVHSPRFAPVVPVVHDVEVVLHAGIVNCTVSPEPKPVTVREVEMAVVDAIPDPAKGETPPAAIERVDCIVIVVV